MPLRCLFRLFALVFAYVVWLVLQFWVGLVFLPRHMDRLLAKEHGKALCFLIFGGVNTVRDWLVPIFFWRFCGRSLLLLLSDTAPPEAEILLLEWKRNRSELAQQLDAIDPVEEAMWGMVIEKARSGGYNMNMDPSQLADNPDTPLIQSHYDKDIELQKITGQLRNLLLSKASVDTQEEESHWRYDHSLWKYKDVRPAGAPSVIFLLCELYFSTISACFRALSWQFLVQLIEIVYCSRDEEHPPNTTLTVDEIHQWSFLYLYLVFLSFVPWSVVKNIVSKGGRLQRRKLPLTHWGLSPSFLVAVVSCRVFDKLEQKIPVQNNC